MRDAPRPRPTGRTARAELQVGRRRVRVGGLLGAGVALLVVGALLTRAVAADPTAAPAAATGRATGSTTADAATTPAPVMTTTSPTAGPTAGTGRSALGLLGTLPVKGRAAMTGYDRAAFGQAWKDTDRNGCDTRNDVLRRDLPAPVLAPGTHDCVVLSGTLVDPYTGRSIAFVRGAGSSQAVQVDHVVALGNAWATGAAGWSPAERELFANDPLNLLAVDGPTNQAKRDGDAATWLPPAHAYRCAYVARQVAVKARYGAWVTPAEAAAIRRVLTSCPDEPVPTGTTPPRRQVAPAAPAAPAAPTATSPPDPRLGTCKAAVGAGLGPYVRGVDPEYDWYRDGDGDGVVCER